MFFRITFIQVTVRMRKEETGEKLGPRRLLFQVFPCSRGSRKFRKQHRIAFMRLPNVCCLSEEGHSSPENICWISIWNLSPKNGCKLELQQELQMHDAVRSWRCLQLFTRPHNKSDRSCVSLNNLLLAE